MCTMKNLFNKMTRGNRKFSPHLVLITSFNHGSPEWSYLPLFMTHKTITKDIFYSNVSENLRELVKRFVYFA